MGQYATEPVACFDSGPPSGPLPLEQEMVWTPTTAKSVYAALREAWNANARWMGGRATPQAVLVLLAQWALETKAGLKCWNWNLANIRSTHPHVQYHFHLGTTEDFPAARARAMVAAGSAAFSDDRDKAPPGRLRIWLRKDCLRHWFSLESGAQGYLATLRANYREALAHVRAGDPAGYARAISEEARGRDRGFCTGPAEIWRDGKLCGGYAPVMQRLFNDYMRARPDRW